MTFKPRLRHVGLYTHDMDAMLAFYTDIMGLTVTDDGRYGDPEQRIVFLSSDPTEHHEFVLADPPAGDGETVHVQQMSFLLDDLDQLQDGDKLRDVLPERAITDAVYVPPTANNDDGASALTLTPHLDSSRLVSIYFASTSALAFRSSEKLKV